MHDLPTRYALVLDLLTCASEVYFDPAGNCNSYPRAPKLSDRQVIALAVTAETLEIDSENYLFAKLREYPNLLPHARCRQSFNRRRRHLGLHITECNALAAAFIDDPGDDVIVDSMPIPTASVKREKRSRAMRREVDFHQADKTFHASSGTWMLGYKLHLITTQSGIYLAHAIRPASHSDVRVLAEILDHDATGALPPDLIARLKDRRLLADRGYDSAPLQLKLYDGLAVELKAIKRTSRRDWEPYDPVLKTRRRTIETVFSQLCDQVRMKLNRAKRFRGLSARVATKLLATTMKQYLNYHTGNSINQTKYCWLA